MILPEQLYSSKITMKPAHYYTLPHSVIFRAEGKDVTRYLHARLTNAIKGLPIGFSCRAAALTPQGKTEGLFTCLHTAETEYLLQCDGGDAELLRAALCRYIVADRVTIEPFLEDVIVVHISADAREKLCKEAQIDVPSGQCLVPHQMPKNPLGIEAIIPASRLGYPGFDIWVKSAECYLSLIKAALGDCKELDSTEFEVIRLTQGSPMFPAEINQEHLLTEAPVGTAIARNKGCYVGQEVVERIESRGATPRLLARFFCKDGPLLPEGAPIFLKHSDGSNERIGEVYSSALSDDGIVGFASIRRQAEPGYSIYLNDCEGRFTWVSED